MLLKKFVWYYPCFYQAIHPLLYSEIYVAVKFIVVRIIFVNYLLGNEVDCSFIIIFFIHWVIKVEVLNIYNELFVIWGG